MALLAPGVHVLNWNEGRQAGVLGEGSPLYCLGPPGARRACFVQFRMESGQTAPPHAHHGWACTVVLEGWWMVNGIKQGPGEMVMIEPGVEYGPFEPGPDGVTGIEFFEHEDATIADWGDYADDPRVVAAMAGYQGDYATRKLRYP